MTCKVLLVDDHAIILDGLEAILNQNPEIQVIAKIANGNTALAYLKLNAAQLIITDYSMPDMDGLTLLKLAKEQSPDIKVIMLSMHDEVSIIREVMTAGVDGYILKKYAQNELIQAIHVIMSGGNYWSREVSSALLNDQHTEHNNAITEREREVLKLLCDEMNSREISEKLFISERTVETHRKNLMRKICATNTVGLIKYAYMHKLIS